MKKLFCYLIYVVLVTELLGDNMQQPKSNKGFIVEIINDSSANLSKKVFVSIENIKRLSQDSTIIKGKENEAATVWLGANLCNVLQEIVGISCKQIKKISISSADGYMSVLSGELIPALNTAICAYRLKGDEVFLEKYGYVRLIFPELRKMYWVNEPEKIVIEPGKQQNTFNEYQFHFIENNRIQALIQQDLKSCHYMVIDDILLELNLLRSNFFILTADSLFREYIPAKNIQNIVLQKEKKETWKIKGINVPVGLKTRRIFFLLSANKGLFLKSLSEDEQILWENLFLKPIVQRISSESALQVELIFNNGKHIISGLTDKFKLGQISLYKFFEKELKSHSEINHIILRW